MLVWYSIPFSTEDLSMAIPAMDYADVELPESLQHYTSVQFLLRQQDPQPVLLRQQDPQPVQ
jgi:myosin-5